MGHSEILFLSCDFRSGQPEDVGEVCHLCERVAGGAAVALDLSGCAWSSVGWGLLEVSFSVLMPERPAAFISTQGLPSTGASSPEAP